MYGSSLAPHRRSKRPASSSRGRPFQRAVCVVTHSGEATTDAGNGCGFWTALGAHAHTLTPKRHDQVLARVSHLPHAIAAALVRLAATGGAIDFAGTGFGDTTRVASGDPALWRDIFASNRSSVLAAIDLLARELAQFRAAVEAGNDAAVMDGWKAPSSIETHGF